MDSNRMKTLEKFNIIGRKKHPVAAVLLLLNTYPLLVSEDLVFRSKETNMTGSVSVVVYSLAGLNRLNQENVAVAMAVVEETGLSRVLVTDSAGLVLSRYPGDRQRRWKVHLLFRDRAGIGGI